MKKILTVSMMVMAMVLGGCTQNDGRIGKLFGTWILESVTDAAGTELTLPEGQTLTWSFQTNVVCMKILLPYHEHLDYWGRFTHSGNQLELNYRNNDTEIGVGDSPYSLPEGYYFPTAPAELLFTIGELSGSRLTVSWVTPESQTLTYRFRKTI